MTQFAVLHHGARSESARALTSALNRRLDARDLDGYRVPVDDVLSVADLQSIRKAAWALGALKGTYEAIVRDLKVPIGVQRMIRNPGTRNDAQLERARDRMSAMRADRARRARDAEQASARRRKVVELALQAAANYRKDPAAYHYLAGGVANLIFLRPSPRDYRSDCSQFVAAIYKAAGLPSPASVPHLWASTSTMVKSPHARITAHPRPGDLGMYGDRTGPLASRYTHHVELYCAAPGAEFIGHGSPPIDSVTPGRPDFYITFDFLD
jgi:cell wall-associated NlpC family hydrolase